MKHIRREELAGVGHLWAVYHCRGCATFGVHPSSDFKPLRFFVPHFNALKEYVRRDKPSRA